MVSIHAPLDRAGRPSVSTTSLRPCRFQSTPRSIERGDRQRQDRGDARDYRGFNPRPARSSGATRQAADWNRGIDVSIHAPLDRAGRRPEILQRNWRRRVSIHAPLDRAGRPIPHLFPLTHCSRFNPRPARSSGATRAGEALIGAKRLFQSTPRSIERGDPSRKKPVQGLLQGFNPRPARSSGATWVTQ